jgi:hypothetical protein
MTRLPGGDADDILRRFPPFPSLAGNGPVQLAKVLASMGEVGLAVEALGRAVMTGPLPPTHREVAILRVAWRLGSAYVWGGHAKIAFDVGLMLGSDRVDGSTADLDVVVTAVDELIDRGVAGEESRARLCAIGVDGELDHMTALVGAYRLIAMLVACRGLEAEPESDPLPDAWPGPGPAHPRPPEVLI